MVGYKHAEMALLDQLKMKLKRTLRENILNIPAFPAFPALHQRRHYRKFNKSIKNKCLALILWVSSLDTPNLQLWYSESPALILQISRLDIKATIHTGAGKVGNARNTGKVITRKNFSRFSLPLTFGRRSDALEIKEKTYNCRVIYGSLEEKTYFCSGFNR